MDKIPFWEETYRNSEINTFPAEPNGTILEFEHLLRKDSAILEIGCGEGQNVRYLAKNGYSDIDAFDLSETGISKLNRLCEREGLRINAFVEDLTKYHFTKSYDLIMTFATLCFVEKDKWRHFIEDAKEHTNPNGIHIIHTFTNTVPASPDIAPFAVGLADEGEIMELYSDWEVLQFKTYVFDDEHPNVPKHQHAVNKLVAQKKASSKFKIYLKREERKVGKAKEEFYGRGRNRSVAIIVRDGKILMEKVHFFERDFCTLPGGGIEEGETPEEAVLREVKEETGLDGKIIRPLTIQYKGDGGSDYSFEVEIPSDAIATTGYDPEFEGEESPLKEVLWMSLDEISEKDRAFLWSYGLMQVDGFFSKICEWDNEISYPGK